MSTLRTSSIMEVPLAGLARTGIADGSPELFAYPNGLAADRDGNIIVADNVNHRIRIIEPSGIMRTLAGSGRAGFADGAGPSAQFRYPLGVAVDCAGNFIVSDYGNHSIRCIAPNGTVTTLAGSGRAGFADGAGASAQFKRPWGVAVDGEGWIIVADHGNHRIRRISPSGNVSTLAGSGSAGFADGAGASAQFHNPVGVAVDGEGNIIASDWFNHRIRKIVRGGTVSTVAGSGFADGFGDIIGPEGTRLLSMSFQRSYLSAGTSAHFNQPWGVAVDGEGNILVADNGNTRIQRITSSGIVSTCFACSGEFRGLVIDTDGMPVAAFFSPE